MNSELERIKDQLAELRTTLSNTKEQHLLETIRTQSLILNLRVKALTLGQYFQQLHDLVHNPFTFDRR